MPKSNVVKFSFIFLCIVAFTLIRGFETKLFYDPFLDYFRGNYQNNVLPTVNLLWLNINYLLRYALNSFISLLVLFLLFGSKSLVKDFMMVYVVAFIILMIGINLFLFYGDKDFLSIFFYTRRFLIHPLFLILFIPAILYQKSVKPTDSQ